MIAALALLGLALLVIAPATRGRGAGRHRPGAVRAGVASSLVGAGAVMAACLSLFGGRVGSAVALLLLPFGKAGLDWLRARPESSSCDPLLPRTLDLAAAGLLSGLPVSAALSLAAPAASPVTAARLEAVAGLLRLGAAPGEAWADLAADIHLGGVARIARRGAESGARLAASWEECAAQIRAELRAAAAARAARAGVFAMAPLGLCFLPAFVCLGVVPDALGLFRGAWNGSG